MLDHIQADREIEAVVGEGHLQDRALDHLPGPAGAGKLRAGGESSMPVTCPWRASSTMLRPLPHPASRMRAELPGASPETTRLDHPAPASVPPVSVLRLVGLELVVPVHAVSIFS